MSLAAATPLLIVRVLEMLESMNVDLPGLFEKALERFAADEADLIYAGVSER